MNRSPTLAQQLTLAAVLLFAYAAALLILHARGHLGRLQALGLPAALVVACGIPDALATLRGTWDSPAREGDPYVRVFLQWWGGWWGLCAALALWILAWALVFDVLEMLRLRLTGSGAGAALAGFAQAYLLYALALGHLDGFSAWTHVPSAAYRASSGLLALLAQDASWTRPQATLGYALYPSLTYALLLAALHASVAGVARRLSVALPAHGRSGPAAGAPPRRSRDSGLLAGQLAPMRRMLGGRPGNVRAAPIVVVMFRSVPRLGARRGRRLRLRDNRCASRRGVVERRGHARLGGGRRRRRARAELAGDLIRRGREC